MRALALATLLLAFALPVQAACYADYKAKQDGPLRLHYGVIELPDQACANPAPEVRRRLAARGWTLLNIVSTFGPEGLNDRRANAGPHFLAY